MLMEAFCKHVHIDLASCPSYVTEELLIMCSYQCQIALMLSTVATGSQRRSIQHCVVGQMLSDEVHVRHLTWKGFDFWSHCFKINAKAGLKLGCHFSQLDMKHIYIYIYKNWSLSWGNASGMLMRPRVPFPTPAHASYPTFEAHLPTHASHLLVILLFSSERKHQSDIKLKLMALILQKNVLYNCWLF